MSDTVFRSRSLGVSTEGVPDQYADGVAAKVWEIYIGDQQDRTIHYKSFLTKLLRDNNCMHILDVACGTGIDSIMLLEEGFKIMSVDASDRMLKYALKKRWNRRKEPAFDEWVIEEANWLSLPEDIKRPNDGFDAVICLGNSFTHLLDQQGNGQVHMRAIRNFYHMLKPGGQLIIDHRNYDYTLDTGKTPTTNLYYTSKHIKSIETSVLYTNGQPMIVTLDYVMDISKLDSKFDSTDSEYTLKGRYSGDPVDHFRLSYHPHRLAEFTKLLKSVFGDSATHKIYADFKERDESNYVPGFYIHIIQK